MSKELNEKFLNAVSQDKKEIMIEALREGADLNAVTDSGNNALALAINKKRTDILETLFLLEVRGETINLNNRNMFGETPLFMAVNDVNENKYVQMLIDQGADVNITNNEGMSPLIRAVSFVKYNDIKAILNVPGVNIGYEIPDSKTTAFLMATTSLKGKEAKDIMELLLNNGANINEVDITGKNCLINLLYRQFGHDMSKENQKDNIELCKYLIEFGIDVNHKVDSGLTAFWLASKMSLGSIVDLLLEKGVDVNTSHSIGLEDETSALTYWINGYKGFEFQKERIIKIINAGGQLNAPNGDMNTPASSGFSNPFAKELMLELNADVNTVIYTKGEHNKLIKLSALETVISMGDNARKTVQEMINKGAKVTYKDVDPDFKEPIFTAFSSNAVGIFCDLLETGKIDPNIMLKAKSNANKSKDDISLLSFMVSGSLDARFAKILAKENKINLLLSAEEENKKNNVTSKIIDEDGFNQMREELKTIQALKVAIYENKNKMLEKLMTYNPDVNLKNNNGKTALFFVNDVSYANFLIKNGADLFVENNVGDNILMDAFKNGKNELIKLFMDLYKEKAPEKIERFYYDLAFIDNPSHMMTANIENGIYSLLTEDQLKIVVPENISLTEENKDKNLPSSLDNIKEINYKDVNGNTPVMVACAMDNPFLVKLYIKLGADINVKNNLGETPLMHAVATHNERLVDYLIASGANITEKANNGKTAIDFAEETNNKSIIESISVGLDLIKEGQLTNTKKYKPV